MPRSPRVDFPGAFHHVYARGIEKRPIFADDGDRQELRRRVQLNLSRRDATCLAWAYMSNHFHLLFYSPRGSLADFMRCVMSGYAMYFNRKTGRVGHLFQNRYMSSVIDSERYLFELIRYIHLNPIRSGLVASLGELATYRWTGHRDIVRTKKMPWEQFPFVRDFFVAGKKDDGIARYIEFLADGIGVGPAAAFSDGSGRIDAVPTQEPDAAKIMEEAGRERSLFQKTVERVCTERGIPTTRFFGASRSRMVTDIRRKVLKACVLEQGIPRRMVSAWLGITDVGAAYLLKSFTPGNGEYGGGEPRKVQQRP